MRQISIQISSPEVSIGAFNGAIIAGNPGNSAAALEAFWNDLIPFPHQDDLRMYGNEVMDFTVSGLRSM